MSMKTKCTCPWSPQKQISRNEHEDKHAKIISKEKTLDGGLWALENGGRVSLRAPSLFIFLNRISISYYWFCFSTRLTLVEKYD